MLGGVSAWKCVCSVLLRELGSPLNRADLVARLSTGEARLASVIQAKRERGQIWKNCINVGGSIVGLSVGS